MQIRSLQNFVFPVVCAALTACGGGGSDESAYQRALSMADAKEVEARQLAVDTPCETLAACGRLSHIRLFLQLRRLQRLPQISKENWPLKPANSLLSPMLPVYC